MRYKYQCSGCGVEATCMFETDSDKRPQGCPVGFIDGKWRLTQITETIVINNPEIPQSESDKP